MVVTHGEMRRGRRTKESAIWVAMIQRCESPNCESYANYGGRGIKVCDRWKGSEGLQNFIADMGRKPDGASLDRIDNDGDYSPDNCRWATRKEQQRNRRANVRVTLNGETRCLTEWAEILGINIRTVRKRVNHLKWSPEKALTEPVIVGVRSKTLTINGETKSLREWSNASGVAIDVIRERLASGWDAERAVFQKLRSKK